LRAKGKHPKPPGEMTRVDERSHPSDPDSRRMRNGKQPEHRQAHNARAVVDAGGSRPIVGARVADRAGHRNEPVADIAAIAAELGRPETVPAGHGHANGDAVAALAESDIEALVAIAAAAAPRLPPGQGPPAPENARPSIHPNPFSPSRRPSIAPPTDDNEITQHENPTPRSDRRLARIDARNGAKIRPTVRSTAVIAAGRGNDALPGSG